MRPSSVVDGDEYDYEEVLRQLAKKGPVPARLLIRTVQWAVAEIDVLRRKQEDLPEVQCPSCGATIRARMA